MRATGTPAHIAVLAKAEDSRLTPIWHPSQNFGPRRDGARPELIVLHYTAMESAEAALRALSDPAREVSAHYLIARNGQVFQLVEEEMRAWHAGQGSWCGAEDVNSRSIGIELDNDGRSPFSSRLMDGLDKLLPDVMARHEIPAKGVIGHSDMAPGRKIDPGPRFDWARLERQGLAAPKATNSVDNAPLEKFRDLARSHGYTTDVDDETLLAAIRLRYRPGASGPLESEDLIPLSPFSTET